MNKKIKTVHENTTMVLGGTDVNVYASFISAQNKYNNGGQLTERQMIAKAAQALGLKTHTDVGHEEVLDKHASQAAFGSSLSKIRDETGHNWDMKVVGATAKSTKGKLPTKTGSFVGAKSQAPTTHGSLFGKLVHKSDPSHEVEFALQRDAKGTKVAAFKHNKTGSGATEVNVDHMVNHVNSLTDKAKGYEGLSETNKQHLPGDGKIADHNDRLKALRDYHQEKAEKHKNIARNTSNPKYREFQIRMHNQHKNKVDDMQRAIKANEGLTETLLSNKNKYLPKNDDFPKQEKNQDRKLNQKLQNKYLPKNDDFPKQEKNQDRKP